MTKGTTVPDNVTPLEVKEQKGDLLIRDFWYNGTAACLQKRRHFYFSVASFDRLVGVELAATLNRIGSRLTTKWRKPYSRTCGYVKSMIAITLVLATHQ